MTNLTADDVRRLDALNLIQAHLDHDPTMVAAITGLYPSRDELWDLLASVAQTAAYLVRGAHDGAALLARLREFWLDEERGS